MYTVFIYDNDIDAELYRIIRYRPNEHLDLRAKQVYDLVGAEDLKIKKISTGATIQSGEFYSGGAVQKELPAMVMYQAMEGKPNPFGHLVPKPNSANPPVFDTFTFDTKTNKHKPPTGGFHRYRISFSVPNISGASGVVCGQGSDDFGDPPQALQLKGSGDWAPGTLSNAEQDGEYLAPEWDVQCP